MRLTGLGLALMLLAVSLGQAAQAAGEGGTTAAGEVQVAEARAGETDPGAGVPRANQPPTAVISEPRNGAVATVGTTVSFDGSNSTDPDNDTLKYKWDFGDGEVAHTAKTAHVYRSTGVKLVNLTVNDSLLEDRASILINILPVPNPGDLNTPPTAAVDGNKTGYQTTEIVVFVSMATDANGDNLSYYWDFDKSNGVQWLRPDATGKIVGHIYNVSGNYTVTHWVQEEDTPERYISLPVTVYADITDLPVYPPQVDAGPPITAQVNTEATLSGTAKAQNAGGVIVNYQWDFNNDGTFDWNSNKTGKAQHTYTVVGKYIARLQATDDRGLSAEDTTNVTINPKPNIPPVANAGDDQSVFLGQPVTFHGIGSDEDGQIVRYQWDFDGDGVWDYDNPSSGTASWTYEGPGTFEAMFRVTDDGGATASDSAVITVALKQPPVANAGGDQTVNAGDVVQFDGSASRDPDGQKLTFSWDFDDRDGIQADAKGPVVDYVYTRGGDYTATLTVTNELGKAGKDIALVTVVQTAGVSLATSQRSKNLKPGEEGVFTFIIQNSGNGKDTYALSLSGDNYRWATLDTPAVTLEAGSIATATVSVSPPVDALAGSQAKITLRAVSDYDQNTQAQSQITVTTLQVYSINITSEKAKVTAETGGGAGFNIQVTNTGNGDDRVRLSASGAAGKWASFNPQQAVVSKGVSKTFQVTLSVPEDANPQDYLLVLIASSDDNTTQTTASVTVTVSKASPAGFLPGPTAGATLVAAGVAVSVAAVLRRRQRRP